MNFEVVVTCAIMDAGDRTGRKPRVPFVPAEIAGASIEAALRCAVSVAKRLDARILGPCDVRERLKLRQPGRSHAA